MEVPAFLLALPHTIRHALPMRLVTWNINSLRLRMPLLEKLTTALQPDVVCLQETKGTDELFPHESVRAIGCEHLHDKGMKG